MTRVVVLRHGPITLSFPIEDGLPVHSWYWIGGRAFRVVEVQDGHS